MAEKDDGDNGSSLPSLSKDSPTSSAQEDDIQSLLQPADSPKPTASASSSDEKVIEVPVEKKQEISKSFTFETSDGEEITINYLDRMDDDTSEGSHSETEGGGEKYRLLGPAIGENPPLELDYDPDEDPAVYMAEAKEQYTRDMEIYKGFFKRAKHSSTSSTDSDDAKGSKLVLPIDSGSGKVDDQAMLRGDLNRESQDGRNEETSGEERSNSDGLNDVGTSEPTLSGEKWLHRKKLSLMTSSERSDLRDFGHCSSSQKTGVSRKLYASAAASYQQLPGPSVPKKVGGENRVSVRKPGFARTIRITPGVQPVRRAMVRPDSEDKSGEISKSVTSHEGMKRKINREENSDTDESPQLYDDYTEGSEEELEAKRRSGGKYGLYSKNVVSDSRESLDYNTDDEESVDIEETEKEYSPDVTKYIHLSTRAVVSPTSATESDYTRGSRMVSPSDSESESVEDQVTFRGGLNREVVNLSSEETSWEVQSESAGSVNEAGPSTAMVATNIQPRRSRGRGRSRSRGRGRSRGRARARARARAHAPDRGKKRSCLVSGEGSAVSDSTLRESSDDRKKSRMASTSDSARNESNNLCYQLPGPSALKVMGGDYGGCMRITAVDRTSRMITGLEPLPDRRLIRHPLGGSAEKQCYNMLCEKAHLTPKEEKTLEACRKRLNISREEHEEYVRKVKGTKTLEDYFIDKEDETRTENADGQECVGKKPIDVKKAMKKFDLNYKFPMFMAVNVPKDKNTSEVSGRNNVESDTADSAITDDPKETLSNSASGVAEIKPVEGEHQKEIGSSKNYYQAAEMSNSGKSKLPKVENVSLTKDVVTEDEGTTDIAHSHGPAEMSNSGKSKLPEVEGVSLTKDVVTEDEGTADIAHSHGPAEMSNSGKSKLPKVESVSLTKDVVTEDEGTADIAHSHGPAEMSNSGKSKLPEVESVSLTKDVVTTDEGTTDTAHSYGLPCPDYLSGRSDITSSCIEASEDTSNTMTKKD